MLLFIGCSLLIFFQVFYCFNTSHVVIYPIKLGQIIGVSSVSIHLMLLFITIISLMCLQGHAFQYISCCYLSAKTQRGTIMRKCFNTSHVVIYLFPVSCAQSDTYVSIHLMLLFIKLFGSFLHDFFSFQYISCCYLSREIFSYF